jgi:hypothetical protein
MSLYSGQVNLTRYKVLRKDDSSPSRPVSKPAPQKIGNQGRPVTFNLLDEAMTGWKARPLEDLLDEESGKGQRFLEISTGWVAPEGLMASRDWNEARLESGATAKDNDWTMAMAAVNDGVVLRMRIDRRKVPAALVRAVYRQKLQREERGVKGKTKRLPRAERDALKQHIRASLTGRALPSCTYVDAFWREASGELWVFTTSETCLKAFEELFSRTFGGKLELALTRIQPPMTAAPAAFWEDLVDGTMQAQIDSWLATLAETTQASPER